MPNITIPVAAQAVIDVAEECSEAIERAVAEKPDTITVDFSGVEAVDSAWFGIVQLKLLEAVKEGIVVLLDGLPQDVYSACELTGLDHLFFCRRAEDQDESRFDADEHTAQILSGDASGIALPDANVRRVAGVAVGDKVRTNLPDHPIGIVQRVNIDIADGTPAVSIDVLSEDQTLLTDLSPSAIDVVLDHGDE